LRISPVFLGVILIVQAATPAEANDLMRLYRLALTRDTTLEAAKHRRDAAIEARPQALSQWLPQLSGVGSMARHFISEQAASFGLTEDASTPPPLGSFGLEDCARKSVTTVHCSADSTSYGLTLTQTVWSYEAYSQLKQADAQVASAEATYVSAQQDLLLRMAQAYFAVLAVQDQLSTLRLEREAYAMQLKQTQDREQTGLGSRSDVEQAKSFYDLTAQNLINSQNTLDDAELTLATIVGEPPGHIAPLMEQIPLIAPDPVSADAWADSALRDNPEVRAAELTAEAAEREISVQRGKAMPTLALAGTGTRASGPLVLGGDNTVATVGVHLNWPLFQGGAVTSAVRQSRALYHQSESNLEAIKRDRVQQTRAAYRNILSGIESIKAGRVARDSAYTAMQTARHDIEFNVSPMFILLQYQAQYYLAVNAYDQARYRYLANVLLPKKQAGRLAEQDLAMIDSLLVTAAAGE
jgi:outer membrane protein